MKYYRISALLLLIAFLLTLAAGCSRPKDTQDPTDTETKTDTELSSETNQPTDQPETKPTNKGILSGVEVPASATTEDDLLADMLLTLCTGGTAGNTKKLAEQQNFTVVCQKNFDKNAADTAHTCAFTIAKKDVTYNGNAKTAYLVLIRGTDGGEWISNFNLCDSGNYDTQYAENFKACADNVYKTLKPLLGEDKDALCLIAGHSRGAAAANLLGVVMAEDYNPKTTYVYTFACPETICGEAAEKAYPNIFNFNNAADFVPYLPLYQWGFRRAGTDITMQEKPESSLKTIGAISELATSTPDLNAYYTEKLSLTQAGSASNGMTAHDFAVLLLRFAMLSPQLPAGGQTGMMPEGAGMPGFGLPTLSPKSDLFPIFSLLTSFSDPATGGIAAQHMPDVYHTLIRARIDKNN